MTSLTSSSSNAPSDAVAAHPYDAGLADGTLRYQACTACHAWQPLERHACRQCGGTSLAWRDAVGLATIYAASEIWRAPTDAFRALVPYTLVLATLDEGPRVMGHGEPGLVIGERVRADFFTHAEQTLLRFRRE
jgi:uncharacterized OB-fold protein